MDTLWGTDILNIIDSSLVNRLTLILCDDCIMYLNQDPNPCLHFNQGGQVT